MVVTRAFAAAETGVTHDRTGLPSISTVQAPHWASPQPNFGPFSSRSFLSTYRSGASGSTDTVVVLPFTRRLKLAMIASSVGLRAYHSGPSNGPGSPVR